VTYYVVLASYACRLLVAQWYETRGIVDTRDTCAVSRYGIVTLATLVSSTRYRR